MKILTKYWLILIFILVFFLRLPSLFEPYSYGDEAIYLTLGEGARQGLVFYRDIHDNKPPILYLLATISGGLFWFRFILLVWNLATIYAFLKLALTLFPNREKIVRWATLVFALLTSLPLLEGNIANAEIFMILPTIMAVFLLFRGEKTKPSAYFFAGILFSLAALFKIPAAFDFAAIAFFVVFFKIRKDFSLIFSHFPLLVLGFAVPIFLSFLYYWSQGALPQYFTAAFAQNLPYLSTWQGSKSSSDFFNFGIMNRGVLLLLATSIIWLSRKKLGETTSLIFLWFLFALFGATLSGRPYPHYLVQILPPASLLLITFLLAKGYLKIAILGLFGLIWGSVVYFHFWSYPNLSYYQNFLSFALGQKSREEYFRGFGDKTPQTYKLAEFLQNHTNPREKVFIWGEGSLVYALSRRLPPGKYTTSYHIIDFKGSDETISLLKQAPPRFIIDLNDEDRPFPELFHLINERYLLFKTIGKAEIYLLVPTK
ncbi:MAG: hypothetical protein Q8Q15_01765 [bacterium]|nr:hypothetical protein [bacterium]